MMIKDPSKTGSDSGLSDMVNILPVLLLMLYEGSLEVKLPTIWTDEKQSREEAERRGRLEERKVEEKE